MYPTLQLLQDEGFVTVEERDGKRIFSLTDEGRAETERRTAEAGETPWTRDGRGKPAVVAMFESVKLLHMAAHQIVKAGSADQVTAATEALNEARKKLYQLLAAE